MLLRSAIQLFLNEQYCLGNSDITIEDYKTKISFFERYICSLDYVLSLDLDYIDYDLLFGYTVYLRSYISNSVTIQSYIRSLRSFLNWCYSCGYIQEDFCKRFKLPKARKSFINVLTDEEITRIYSCYPNGSNSIHLRNRVIISLMLDCGLRLDEVVSASRDKLHLAERYLIVTGKGNKQRAVSFGNTTYSLLKRYLAVSPRASPLLLLSDGSPLTRSTIKNMFRRLKVKSGVDRLYPHLLRHTFATCYLENGGDIYSLKDLLGHTTLKQTQQYLHIASTRIHRDFSRFSPLDNIKNAKP